MRQRVIFSARPEIKQNHLIFERACFQSMKQSGRLLWPLVGQANGLCFRGSQAFLFLTQRIGWVDLCNFQRWYDCGQKRHQYKGENHGGQR
jgi:hypothetical protein